MTNYAPVTQHSPTDGSIFLKVHIINDKDINLTIKIYFTLQDLMRDCNSY